MTGVGSPDAKATFGWPFSFALNRLLQAEPWAREELAPFAGMTLELRPRPFPGASFVILPGGSIEAAGGAPDLVITVAPEGLLAMLRGAEHFFRSIEVTGDARLASAVMRLVRDPRWDVEEQLSRLVGDVAAHRLAGLARGFAAWQADGARRLAEGMADYAVEEKRLLVARRELEEFSARVRTLCDAVERLEKRVRRLG